MALSASPTESLRPNLLHGLTAAGFSQWAAIAAVAIGSVVLAGWTSGIIVPAFPAWGAMKANTALALILSGAALWFLTKNSPAANTAARMCALAVSLIGFITLAEYLLGRDFRVDEILLKDLSTEADLPGRMDAATAGMLVAIGVALSLLGDSAHVAKAQAVAVAAGAASLLVLAGYIYLLPALYSFGPVAPHTALAIFVVAAGIVYARPGSGLLAHNIGDGDVAATIVSRLLPGAFVIPLVLGGLALLGHRRAFYDAETGLALFALSTALLWAAFIVWSARSFVRISSRQRDARLQAERELARVKVLRASAAAISTAADPTAVCTIVLKHAEMLLPSASAVTLRIVNRDTGELEPTAAASHAGVEWTIAENKALGGRAAKVLETKTPMSVRNLQTDGQVYNQIYRKEGWASYLGVPLITRGEAVGVLGLYTKQMQNFSRDEIDALAALAFQAAPIFTPTSSHGIVVAAPIAAEPISDDGQLRKSLKLLPGLYAALAPLNPAESIVETVDAIVEKLIEATGADAALIRVWKKETGASLVAGHHGLADDYVKQMEIGLLKGAMDRVMQTGEPIIAADIEADTRFTTKVQQQLGFRSSAVLPLKIHNDVRGIMYVASRSLGFFNEGENDLLVAIAQQMGISMENRELFDHLKGSRDEMEKANKVKGEFLSVMSHELRTPLSVVMGYAGMIKEGLLGAVNDKQEDALEKLLSRANDQLNMINAIMQITQLESRSLVLERHLVNLSEMLSHLKADYALSQTKGKVALDWNFPVEPIVIVTDGGKLKEILVNLINNALKFTTEGSVTVAMQTNQNARKKWVQLSVADTGVGIPKEQFSTIFEKFYQVDSSETRLYGGVGLGLYIVKQFAEFLGGRVDVVSEPGRGSTFTVVIPYAT